MLLFTLRAYANNHGAIFSPNKNDSGWHSLRKALVLRDHLMHPKSFEDLQVTDAAGTDFASEIQWWDNSVDSLLRACEPTDKKILEASSPASNNPQRQHTPKVQVLLA